MSEMIWPKGKETVALDTTTGVRHDDQMPLDTTTGVRHEIHVFACAMEHKLKLNEHKGGWADKGNEHLLARLRGEVEELEQAIARGNYLDILFEASDIANYAMMIAWNCLRGVTK